MKNLNASFTDLNGKTIKIETFSALDTMISFATTFINRNDADAFLPEKYKTQIKEYWQHRLNMLLAIKAETSKTLYQHWQTGAIGNFGSFQNYVFMAYQRADSINTQKLNTAFPEWFVNPYQL